jgi:hypothetical protein
MVSQSIPMAYGQDGSEARRDLSCKEAHYTPLSEWELKGSQW